MVNCGKIRKFNVKIISFFKFWMILSDLLEIRFWRPESLRKYKMKYSFDV
jgi:hypothetical protein